MIKKVLLGSILLLFISCTTVPPGEVGIKVNLYGSDKGVEDQILPAGRYFVGPIWKMYTFPTYMQNVAWTSDRREGSPVDEAFTFQSAEGAVIKGSFGLSYRLEEAKISTLFQQHRKGINEITQTYLKNVVRNALTTAASEFNAEDINGSQRVAFLQRAERIIRDEVEERGFIIENFSSIGNFILPTNIQIAINNRIEATQRAQARENELREARAQAEKDAAQAEGEARAAIARAQGEAEAILVRARAQAEANQILARSITPNLIEYEKVGKWNGALPTVSSDGAIMLDFRK